MPFDTSDVYTVSAGTELFNYFNPFVTKFDSQSFYNFEQDNQPLYDLEERTVELWGKATGYATSSITGMPLLVSSTGYSSNRNVFTNLQEAIDALPNVIRTPTIIEVATSGNLGGLQLKNIKITEDGALEILNRGCAKIYSGRSHSTGDLTVDSSSVAACKVTSPAYIPNVGIFTEVSSIDLWDTIRETSALTSWWRAADGKPAAHNVSGIFNNYECNRTFVNYINFTDNRKRNDKVTVGFIGPHASNKQEFILDDHKFNVRAWELAAQGGANPNITDLTTKTYDVSASRGDDGARLQRNSSIPTTYTGHGGEVAGLTYCNVVSSIDIQNCNGPLYVRGFCVDSVSGADANYVTDTPYKNPIGIVVKNSNPVLENCSVIRSKQYGAEFTNSDVDISRGFYAYRNYEVLAGGVDRSTTKTAGIHAVNSRLRLLPDMLHASGSDFLFQIQDHDYGMLLENSVVVGGQSKPIASDNDAVIGLGYNDIGLAATDSVVSVSGNLDIYNNNIGMKLINSRVDADRLTLENHTNEGVKSRNSVVQYGNSLNRRNYNSDVSGFRMAQYLFHRNGSHLDLEDASKFTYYKGLSSTYNNVPIKFGGLRLADSHGVVNPTQATKFSIPSVSLNQSEADFLHSRIITSSVNNNAPALAGAAVHAANASRVNFLGTVSGATIIEGPRTVTNSKNLAGVGVLNSSKASFRGPTVIVQFGVDALADNNSTLEFCPHKVDDATLDVSGFRLENAANHTAVELQSTFKSCLAATNNSQIIMEDLGSPEQYYTTVATDYGTENTQLYTSAGSMQFYPNPGINSYVTVGHKDDLRNVQNLANLSDTDINSDGMSQIENNDTANTTARTLNYYLTNPWVETGASSLIHNFLSMGGLCVQAFGGSVIKANGVHFPTGYANPRGSFYDPSAGGALAFNDLYIWNIGDDSKLYASHLAVSGHDPSAAWVPPGENVGKAARVVYHGPRAAFLAPNANGEWGTGAVGDVEELGASGTTPDTGTISVLDFFGQKIDVGLTELNGKIEQLNLVTGGNTNHLGWTNLQNKGPFRIFFGPNSAAKYLGYVSGAPTTANNELPFALNDTRPMQHFAQGYSLSGVAGLAYEVLDASTYNPLLISQTPHRFTPSGFYYTSAMLGDDHGTHAYIDQTAANTFANAKNCAMEPLSGRSSPKVSITKSTTDKSGDGSHGEAGVPIGTGLRSINQFDIRREI